MTFPSVVVGLSCLWGVLTCGEGPTGLHFWALSPLLSLCFSQVMSFQSRALMYFSKPPSLLPCFNPVTFHSNKIWCGYPCVSLIFPWPKFWLLDLGWVFFPCSPQSPPSFHDFVGQVHNIEIACGEWLQKVIICVRNTHRLYLWVHPHSVFCKHPIYFLLDPVHIN